MRALSPCLKTALPRHSGTNYFHHQTRLHPRPRFGIFYSVTDSFCLSVIISLMRFSQTAHYPRLRVKTRPLLRQFRKGVGIFTWSRNRSGRSYNSLSETVTRATGGRTLRSSTRRATELSSSRASCAVHPCEVSSRGGARFYVTFLFDRCKTQDLKLPECARPARGAIPFPIRTPILPPHMNTPR